MHELFNYEVSNSFTFPIYIYIYIYIFDKFFKFRYVKFFWHSTDIFTLKSFMNFYQDVITTSVAL